MLQDYCKNALQEKVTATQFLKIGKCSACLSFINLYFNGKEEKFIFDNTCTLSIGPMGTLKKGYH